MNLRKTTYAGAVFAGIALVTAVVGPLATYAHGTGQEFTRVVDGYQVDVAANAYEFTVGENVQFDFALSDTDADNTAANFSDVWVQIYKDDRVYYAGTLAARSNGSALMVYQFPEAGTYELATRYAQDGQELAGASFTLEVAPSDEEEQAGVDMETVGLLAVAAAAGLVVGGMSVMFFSRRTKVTR